jgi:type I restriction enzyme, S subunit
MRMNKREKVILVPRLRFPEFKNNGAINLENGSVIFESISNKNHNSDLPVLAITQEHGAIPRDQIDYNVSVTDKSLESYKVVEIGDFIISLRSFQGGIEYSLYHGICSPAYIILRKKTPINEQYYKYYFKTNKFIQDLNKDLEGIRDGKMVSYSQFSSILLPKPENKEQQKIAECFSSLDGLISAEDKKLEALKAHKQGLMQKLFPTEGETVPEWRFQEFRGSSEWEERKLSKVCAMQAGKFVKASEIFKERKDNMHPCYGGNGLRGYTFSYTHSGEYPLIGRQGALCGNVTYGIGDFHATEHAVVATKSKGIIEKWLYYLLINLKLNQYATGQAQPGLSVETLEKITTCVPKDEKEQQKIADCLSSLDDRIISQADKIEVLQAHKKGLMQGLFPSIKEVSE